METYHEFEHKGQHYRLVHDEDHETRGSYAYDTEEATKAAEDEELEKLNSGEWVVLGCIVTKPCEGLSDDKGGHMPGHCEACSGTVEVDSLWGIVIENSTAKAEAYAKEVCGGE
jgi:hypothetical protein